MIADKPALLRAMRAGVREALRRHKLLGESIVVWKNGRVVVVPPEQIPVAPVRRRGGRAGAPLRRR